MFSEWFSTQKVFSCHGNFFYMYSNGLFETGLQGERGVYMGSLLRHFIVLVNLHLSNARLTLKKHLCLIAQLARGKTMPQSTTKMIDENLDFLISSGWSGVCD